MLGFPTETKQEMEKTVEFALSLPLARASFTKVTPLPGTELFDLWEEKYSKNGKVDWTTFNYYQFDADWADCSFEEIAKIQTNANFRFYIRPKVLFPIAKRMIFGSTNHMLPISFILTGYKRAFIRLCKIFLSTKLYNSVMSRQGTITKDDSVTKQQVPAM